jgi:hypothetical protein
VSSCNQKASFLGPTNHYPTPNVTKLEGIIITNLISFLDAITPFVQAFDALLMFGCGFYCLRASRRRRNGGITLLAIACFFSAVILVCFFLSASYHNHPLLGLSAVARQWAYLIARALAPLELLLFAAAIILVVRRSASASTTPT